MNKIIFSFLTTILAGLTTIIGIIPCFIKDKYKDITISSSLAFSAGIMIMISVISLIPEAIILQTETNNLFPAVIKTSIFIVIGIIISNTINHKLDTIKQNKLYTLGIISIIIPFSLSLSVQGSSYIYESFSRTFAIRVG